MLPSSWLCSHTQACGAGRHNPHPGCVHSGSRWLEIGLPVTPLPQPGLALGQGTFGVKLLLEDECVEQNVNCL